MGIDFGQSEGGEVITNNHCNFSPLGGSTCTGMKVLSQDLHLLEEDIPLSVAANEMGIDGDGRKGAYM